MGPILTEQNHGQEWLAPGDVVTFHYSLGLEPFSDINPFDFMRKQGRRLQLELGSQGIGTSAPEHHLIRDQDSYFFKTYGLEISFTILSVSEALQAAVLEPDASSSHPIVDKISFGDLQDFRESYLRDSSLQALAAVPVVVAVLIGSLILLAGIRFVGVTLEQSKLAPGERSLLDAPSKAVESVAVAAVVIASIFLLLKVI